MRRPTPALSYGAIGAGAIGAYYLLPTVSSQDLFFVAVSASGTVAILAGVAINRPARRRPWYLIALGFAAFALGDLIWAIYEVWLGVESPFPSVADASYLAGYPLIAGGLVLLVRSRTSKARGRGALLDAAIVTAALGLTAWVYLMAPYANDAGMTLLEQAISIAYPLMDVLMLGVAAHLLLATRVRGAANGYLVGSLLAYLATDLIYGVLVLGDGYLTGGPLDAGWLAGNVLMGMAALHPSMRDLSERGPDRAARLTSGKIAVLVAAVVLTPVIQGLEALGENPLVAAVTVGTALLLFAFVTARLAGLVREATASLRTIAEQSERIRAEQSVSAELRGLHRMKNEFVANVSHELRTPLTSIIGYARSLERPEIVGSADTRKEFVGGILRQSERLHVLVEDLLSMARLDGGTLTPSLQPIDVGDLCEQVVSAIGENATRVTISVSPDLPILLTDARLLRMVVANLLDNALKYSPAHAGCEVGARLHQDGVAIWVKDRGVGIQEEEQARVFDRFYQINAASTRRHGGTGLGLSLVKEIVEILGGSISVESSPGMGSVFTVALPSGSLAASPAEPATRTPAAEPV